MKSCSKIPSFSCSETVEMSFPPSVRLLTSEHVSFNPNLESSQLCELKLLVREFDSLFSDVPDKIRGTYHDINRSGAG